ncbi:hypothetical protein JCM10914A_18510 [Paenibacillus sp. JCM 10914]|uniref:sigma-70 family RNA polymerase sigma factor n=1 Tax=Paenibacillus sp. JCM 10914 TaxID=1236974 RepID=UPI0003CC6968|nr:sigma-70 family RNA polymerase sigma factor [Paenibacillus sp. JCM 10914]GAE06275.1 RNA polymerase sigma factor SigW [Paenibacillus sp. JCM 10914]
MATESVDQVDKGDVADVFSEVVSKYANAVYGVAYGKLGNYHTAQDIAQEVFIKTFRHLSNLKKPEKLGNWLYVITVRECIDWFRSSKNKMLHEWTEKAEEAQAETVEDHLLRQELRHEVWNALNTLSEVNRTIIILYYMDEYKIREISEFLGLSVDAVESRLRRSRRLLKKEMLCMVNEDLNQNKLNDEFKKRVFQDERMSQSQFHRVVMGESDFEDIDMYSTRFSNINLEGSHLENINMSRSIFRDINMHQVRFDDVGLWEIEVHHCELGGAYFHDIMKKGEGNRFENCELNGTIFLNCNLSNVDIKDCDISGLTINGISIQALLEHYNNS